MVLVLTRVVPITQHATTIQLQAATMAVVPTLVVLIRERYVTTIQQQDAMMVLVLIQVVPTTQHATTIQLQAATMAVVPTLVVLIRERYVTTIQQQDAMMVRASI